MSKKNVRKPGAIPAAVSDVSTAASQSHAFCGMWADREDMRDPVAYIRKMREPRYTWDDKLGVVRTQR